MTMRQHVLGLAICAALAGCTASAPVRDSTPGDDANAIPRAYDGKPDLSGIWQVINTANDNLEAHVASAGLPEHGAIGATPPGRSMLKDRSEIPYQAWAKEKALENAAAPVGADPEAKCFLPGVPRATYLPHPFQILQGTGKIMVVYGFAEANRTIHMDIEDPKPAPIDSWMGRSHGRWEGDTLVVEAAGFNGEAWLDRAGNFTSYQLKVEERYTPMSNNAILYEATLTDPSVYTEPWTISMPIYRRLEPDVEILEYKCVEFSEELLYGHLRRGVAQ